ncbi:hypothetical protein [Acidicapsa acidisoli]|uniref:hypothetical protein n=1 Tax=Acidicapsa acidisoli TaxID=1615681 RepID=UPI0021DF865A|nr:hypothetical protein [Acidicapsa acidisoli]
MTDPQIELALDAIEVFPKPQLRSLSAPDPGPFPRSSLRCPVFPGVPPRERQDQSVLEDAQDSSKKLFLARYRLATYSDEAGVTRQQIHLRRAAQYTIVAELVPYPAPELGDSARTAAPAPGIATRSVLQLQILSRDRLEKQFDFQRLEDSGGRLRATLTVSSTDEQIALDELIRDTGGIRFELALTRKLDLASMENPGEIERYNALIRGTHGEIASLEMRLSRSGSRLGPERMAIIYDGDSPANLRRQIAECRGRLDGYYAALARTNRWLVATVTLPTQEPMRFRSTDLALERPRWQGLILQTTKAGRIYFQKASQLNQFYYLPEYFDLVAENGSPKFLKIRAAQGFGRFQIEYQAFPRVDKQGRLLKDARTELLEIAGDRFSSVELLPLQPDSIGDTKVTYTLRLPDEDDLQWRDRQRPNSCQDLHHRITDSFEVGPLALKRIYDAMFGGSATLFTGKIEVKMGEWAQTVEFRGRVEGDREALWNRIFEEAGADFSQTIDVRSPAIAFTGDVTAVRVEFKPGNEVTLTRDALTGKGRVDMRISDFVLNREVSADYSYRLHVVRQSGTTTRDWQVSKEDILNIAL